MFLLVAGGVLFKPCCLSSIVFLLFCTILLCWKINIIYVCMYIDCHIFHPFVKITISVA